MIDVIWEDEEDACFLLLQTEQGDEDDGWRMKRQEWLNGDQRDATIGGQWGHEISKQDSVLKI